MSDYESHLCPGRGIYPLGELTARSAADFGEQPVMRIWEGGSYRELTYNRLHQRVTAVARWLTANGLKPGDRAGVLGENRPEWGLCYLAIQTAGGVAVPVDSLMPQSGIRHILNHSGARFLFVSGKYFSMVQEEMSLPALEKIICWDQSAPDVLTLSAIEKEDSGVAAVFPQRTLDDSAAILYTSGTTGYSKGVMLSHRNVITNVESAYRVFGFGPGDAFLSVLPIHHAFECTAGFLLPLYCGASITYARSLKSSDIIEDIKSTKVTVMVGVPLLYEKMKTGIVRGIKKKGKVTHSLFNLMYGTSALGEKVGMKLGAPLFRGLREKAGLNSLRFLVSGGGPLDPTVAEFFVRLGIQMRQGYGLTETSPVSHANPPWYCRNETVGLPIPQVQCRIDNPQPSGIGEVCLKGPNVFIGYFENEEATRKAFDDEGWFHTGDLGIIHPDGTLQIKGRAKNVIVTGGGKNVYPEEIEFYLDRSPFIAESLVLPSVRASGYGEEVVALIHPDYEAVDRFFAAYNVTPKPEDVHKLIASEIAKCQQELAEYKRITKFRLFEDEFQKTSTRKIKRFLYSGEMVKVA